MSSRKSSSSRQHLQESLQKCLEEWIEWHQSRFLPGYEAPHLENAVISLTPDLVRSSSWEEVGVERRKEPFKKNIDYEISQNIPLYNRDGETHKRKHASIKCTNCGSYSHTYRQCFREYAAELVEEKNTKKGQVRRYYLPQHHKSTPSLQGLRAQYYDIKPGRLSEETRKALGIGDDDPPPWQQRMKTLGIPPRYRKKNRLPGMLQTKTLSNDSEEYIMLPELVSFSSSDGEDLEYSHSPLS